MAKNNEIYKLLLEEIRQVKNEIKEVRQTDVPSLNTKIETFGEKLKQVKEQQTWSTRIYTLVGGAIAVFIAHITSQK